VELIICVEPWMAKTNEFNRKEGFVMISGNENLKIEFNIELEE
jgi:hypothetical protein